MRCVKKSSFFATPLSLALDLGEEVVTSTILSNLNFYHQRSGNELTDLSDIFPYHYIRRPESKHFHELFHRYLL